ncbi:hypothetical protein [Bathycoccus sp. RCC716 virus 1]|uniref:SAP domain-containing protein n=1 Tax=Bathycoccus sp. RCC716 virus 1 TaxID=2530038 RepID=A0A7S6NXY1_9PHYC|nr:hypothetical protein [Bathycoccus sp. RCC716 virus 1]
MRKYLFFASGVISTILVFKLFFRKPPPESELLPPPLEDPDESSSSEEYVVVTRTLTSRGNTHDKRETILRPKLSHMKKQELIDECARRNISTVGTVRVLRERLSNARGEEEA